LRAGIAIDKLALTIVEELGRSARVSPLEPAPFPHQLVPMRGDGDRFEGKFRDGVHTADVADLMRRMVKENLLKFDATPLFPERVAYTVPYKLSDAEAALYKSVTEYVREEFNRAEALENDKRAGTVGFALTILQRRLASSPEAIYQSLRRRRERLESRLRELEVLHRGSHPPWASEHIASVVGAAAAGGGAGSDLRADGGRSIGIRGHAPRRPRDATGGRAGMEEAA
jgi:hypothetical protein